jgi:predicted PurR-regulated permease PerM
MTTLGWIAIATLAVLTMMLAVLVVFVVRLTRSVRLVDHRQQRLDAEMSDLHDDVDSLMAQADSFAPLLADTRSALRKAQNERLRADDLINTATSLTGTVDSATKFAVTMISSPFVRALSFFSGVKRGFRTLSRKDQPPHDTRVIEPSGRRSAASRALPPGRDSRLSGRGRRRR